MQSRRVVPVLLVLIVVGVTVVAVVRWGWPAPSRDARASPTEPVAETTTSGARAVLAAWDARRSEAWAAGSVELLSDLYVGGSTAGQADAAALQKYVDRDLVVQGLQSQVSSFRVVRDSDNELVLEVTDRVIGASAVSAHGATPLPAGAGWSRRIVLVRDAEQTWRVASVRQLEE
jgi:hypothetical protein